MPRFVLFVSYVILAPFSYQLEAYEAALARNTIVWLETGSGKTMIAIMLMKEIARRLRGGGDKRIIIFLAPTVHLVQQVEVSSHVLLALALGVGGSPGNNLNTAFALECSNAR